MISLGLAELAALVGMAQRLEAQGHPLPVWGTVIHEWAEVAKVAMGSSDLPQADKLLCRQGATTFLQSCEGTLIDALKDSLERERRR